MRILMLVICGILLSCFTANAWINCTPSDCDTGWSDVGVTCEGSECVRICSAELCDLNWTLVHYDQFGWDYVVDVEKNDYSTAYTASNSSLCYRYIYNGSNLTEYEMDIDTGGGDPDPDCVAEVIGGFRQGSGGSSDSWFENLTQYYHGNVYNGGVDYLYETVRAWGSANEGADEYGPTSYTTGVTGLTNGVKGWGDLYCAPNQAACDNISSTKCAIGCYNKATGGYVLQGIYQNVNDESYTYAGHNNILYDDPDADTECDNDYEDYNEMEYVTYKVFSSTMYVQNMTYTCQRTNEAPSASNVQVSPTSANAGNDLICNFTYWDPEDHPEKDSYFQWYINGSLTNITTETIQKNNLAVNDLWNCSVIPSDGLLNGTINSSLNTLSIDSTINDPAMYVGNSLAWSEAGFFNGPAHVTGWDSQLQDALDACIADEEGYCNIPYDFFSNATGIMNISDIKIFGSLNYAPTHDNPILNASNNTNFTTENLTCYPQNVQDANGDEVYNLTNWYLDGESWMSIYLPFEGGTNSTYVKNYAKGYDGNLNVYNEPEWKSDGGVHGTGAYRFEYGNYSEYQRILFDTNVDQIITENSSMCTWVMSHSDPEIDHWANDSGVFEVRAKNWWKNRIFFLIGNVSWKSNTSRFQIYVYNDSINTTSSAGYGSKGWTSDFIVNKGEWYHVCYTFENNASFKIYINGSLSYSIDTQGHWVNLSNISTVHLGFIGHRNNITIDEFRLWPNRILSSQQILMLFNHGKNMISSNETNEGESWICEVTLNDGVVDGEAKNSSLLTVQGAASGKPWIGMGQIYPISSLQVQEGSMFNYTSQVCCYESDCNNISVSLDPDYEDYTTTSHTKCHKGQCFTTLYSGTAYGFEDEIWKPIDELRSFKGATNIQCTVELDPGLNVECVDYNMTSVTLRLYPAMDVVYETPYIPVKVYRRNLTLSLANEESVSIELVETFFLNLYFQLGNDRLVVVPASMGDEIHFGNTSTTITLQDRDSENLEDAMFDEDNNAWGEESYLVVDYIDNTGEVIFLKFNISLLSSQADIEDSTLCLRDSGDISSDNNLDIWYVSNQTWIEENIDDLCNNSVACSELWEMFDTKLRSYNGDNSSNWECITGLENAVQSELTNNHDNVSFGLNNTDSDANDYYMFYSKDYSNSQYRPYLNITYSISSGGEGKSGLIPENTGYPFYTNSSNPVNISLSQNVCLNVTWWVNATALGVPGTQQESYLLFSYANQTSNMSVSNQSAEVNVTIILT